MIRTPGTGILFALLAFAFFATHDAVVKALSASYSVFQIIFFAGLFAFVPVSLMILADNTVANFRPRHPWLVTFRTAAGVVAMSSAFYAFKTLPLTEVYAILFMTPLLITALSVPFLGETVGLRRWLAVAVGLAGVLVILRPGYAELHLGHLTAIAAAFGSAATSLIVRKIGSQERAAVLILFPMLANTAGMAVILPFVYRPVPIGDLGALALLGGLVFVAQIMIIEAYRRAHAAQVAPLQYSQIIWATLFGAFIFGETPDKWVAIGAAITICSGLFVLMRESTGPNSRKTPLLKTWFLKPTAGPSLNPSMVRGNADRALDV
ncbi:MAG: DMT family transporter [Paracoccaceae bacterium]